MPGHEKCGGHCPEENMGANRSVKCRICKHEYHLPCYDVIESKSKLFITVNIVFICDACLIEIDESPEMERKNTTQVHSILRQATLTPSGSLAQTIAPTKTPTSSRNTTTKTKTNEQMIEQISKKIDAQTEQLNLIQGILGQVGTDVLAVNDLVAAQTSKPVGRPWKNWAEKVYGNHSNGTSQTPNASNNNGNKMKPSYSRVLQDKLPVTPKSNTPMDRKREKHISLIDNATGETVKSAKIKTPIQGKKDTQIGRPVVDRRSAPKPVDPLSKGIWISKFHPETTTEELENYIIENTAVKDKSKFKCSKLVKKEADVTQMKFVSFKIAVAPDDFDELMKPENWPRDKLIREFEPLAPPKKTLGDFMRSKWPTPNAATAHKQASEKTSREADNEGEQTLRTTEDDINDLSALIGGPLPDFALENAKNLKPTGLADDKMEH